MVFFHQGGMPFSKIIRFTVFEIGPEVVIRAGLFFAHFSKTQLEKNSENLKTEANFFSKLDANFSKTQNTGNLQRIFT